MGNYRSEIERFIYEICFSPMWEATASYINSAPSSLDLSRSRIKYPTGALLEDMLLEFPCNISIQGDQLCFDAVVSCTILLEENSDYCCSTYETKQWLRISCEATVTDKLDNLRIISVCRYSKDQKKQSDVIYSHNIVPYLRKEDLDDEAERFLKEFCPEALEKPMRIPIEEIATQMGLTVIQGKCITTDFSVFGEICFSAGQVHVWDLFQCQEDVLQVSRGTILIDAYTFWERNLGCVNNTIAHEVYHWYKHRMYAAIKQILSNKHFIICRCPSASVYPKGNEEWTDEQRMEWQANSIAPRILMPTKTFEMKAGELYQKYAHLGPVPCKMRIELIVGELASFFEVSRQSVIIRMCELEYPEAQILNTPSLSEQNRYSIDISDAFFAYCTNSTLRDFIDDGLFVYAQNVFVINDEKYVYNVGEEKQLTSYALEHLDECSLAFSWKSIHEDEYGDLSPILMRRANAAQKAAVFSESDNRSVISVSDEVRKKRAEFERQNKDYRLVSPYRSGWDLMGEIIRMRGISKAHFCNLTGLDEIVYRRATKGEDTKPSLSTILAFSCGLNLDIDTTNKIMQLSSHTLDDSDEHRAYAFCITGMSGMSLEAKNEFLSSYGYPTLGSKQLK